MPKPKYEIGKHRHRVIVCKRTLTANGDNGEDVESWPEPTPGEQEYWSALDSLTPGETIAQGLRQTLDGRRLRLRGRNLPVAAVDRLRMKATGTLYSITAVAFEEVETVVTIEAVAGDPGVRLLEDGTPRLLEDGGFLLLES